MVYYTTNIFIFFTSGTILLYYVGIPPALFSQNFLLHWAKEIAIDLGLSLTVNKNDLIDANGKKFCGQGVYRKDIVSRRGLILSFDFTDADKILFAGAFNNPVDDAPLSQLGSFGIGITTIETSLKSKFLSIFGKKVIWDTLTADEQYILTNREYVA